MLILLCNIAETCGMLVLATVIPQNSVSRGIPLYIVFIGAHVFQWLPSGFFFANLCLPGVRYSYHALLITSCSIPLHMRSYHFLFRVFLNSS